MYTLRTYIAMKQDVERNCNMNGMSTNKTADTAHNKKMSPPPLEADSEKGASVSEVGSYVAT